MAQTKDKRLLIKCEETIKTMSRLKSLVRSSFTCEVKKRDAEMLEKHVKVIRMVDDILDEMDELKEMAKHSNLKMTTDNRHTMTEKMNSLKKWIRQSLTTKRNNKQSVDSIGKVKKEEMEMVIERHFEVIEMVDSILDCIDKLNNITQDRESRHANMDNQSQQPDADTDLVQTYEDNSSIEESVLEQSAENGTPTTAGSSTASRDEKKARHQHSGVNYRKVKKEGKVGLECMACSFFTLQYAQLYRHIETVHQTSFFYVCDECDNRSTTMQDWKEHLKNEHPNIYKTQNKMKPTRQCSACDFTTDEIMLLVKHLKTTHGSTRSIWECDKCTFVTFHHSQLKDHRSIHMSADCVLCVQCGQAFRSARGLFVHTKQLHR